MHKNNICTRVTIFLQFALATAVTAPPLLSLVSLLKVLTLPRVDAECQPQCSGQLIGGKHSHTGPTWSYRPNKCSCLIWIFRGLLKTSASLNFGSLYLCYQASHQKTVKAKGAQFIFQLQITRRFGDLSNALKKSGNPIPPGGRDAGTGRQPPPLSSVLYRIISKRRSVVAAQVLLREKSSA
jgi:hypothetical protein